MKMVGEALLLGDEALALGAEHAGISAAYGYPGTPSTEILEVLVRRGPEAGFVAQWTANEKTAYEQALGISLMGRRALVTMKHVGLNVAADPFVNSALVGIGGGLVVAVADDPGMHSSQNEQDTRVLADFARVPCFEPADQQETYEMVREAFEVSERFSVPVVVRLVTRLCHGRSVVGFGEPRPQNPMSPATDPASWILLPANARTNWRRLVDTQPELAAYAAASPYSAVTAGSGPVGVITCGIARNYYLEHAVGLETPAPHLHLGVYPLPEERIRRFAETVDTLLVIEEGYPYLERRLRGLLPGPWTVRGKLDGTLPPTGELTPDIVGGALGVAPHATLDATAPPLPGRPPQLCQGCPHRDSYDAVLTALGGFVDPVVTADIGCYTLGALPPYEALHSCVCMGASIGMAKGASDAGQRPALAVIGDSTFLHSGVTPLMDAAANDTDMTVLILDNQTVGMTGQQPTVLADNRIQPIVVGVGADPHHVHVVDLRPHRPEELAGLLRKEMEHPGLSVIVAVRECIEATKRRKREQR